MAEIVVTVTVSESGEELLSVAENQHPLRADGGAVVNWTFVDSNGAPFPEPLEVEFHAFLPERSTTARSANHPFEGQFSRGQLTGIVDSAAPDGLYIYSVFHRGQSVPIKWADPPLFSTVSFRGFFGGVQKPAGPPGGG